MTQEEKQILLTIKEYHRSMRYCCNTKEKKYYYDLIVKEYQKNEELCKEYWNVKVKNVFGMPYDRRVLQLKEIENTSSLNHKKKGLYFIGQTFFNPHTKEEIYCVKIGMSINIAQRMKEYSTHTPNLWKIDNKELQGISSKEIKQEERKMHGLIAECSLKHYENSEWYQVDRNTYLSMCDKGFQFFDN